MTDAEWAIVQPLVVDAFVTKDKAVVNARAAVDAAVGPRARIEALIAQKQAIDAQAAAKNALQQQIQTISGVLLDVPG